MNNISTHPYFWRVFLFLALLLGFSHHAMAEFVETQSIVHVPTYTVFSQVDRNRRERRARTWYYTTIFYPRRPWRLSFSPIKVEIALPKENAVILEDFLNVQGTATHSDSSGQLDRVEIQITNGTFFLSDDGFVKKPAWLMATGTDDWSYSSSTNSIPISSFPPGNYKITVKAFDTNGKEGKKAVSVKNGMTLSYTELSLHPNSPTILQNDPIEVTGKLRRLPHFAGIDLSDNTIILEITAPNGKSELKITKTDKFGNYHFTNLKKFTHKGTYILLSSFAGNNSLFSSESEPKEISVGSSAGYAIIVQGKISNNEGLKAHNKTLNRVYKKLKDRGFIADNIRYFNYKSDQDIDKDGINDIFASPKKSDIQNTIETWACERIKGSPAPLYLIMVDHGSPNQFHLGNETITPFELNTWLDNLEICLEEVSEPRIIIIGSCYSGSFIPTLSKKGRMIITSASENEVSYKGLKESYDVRSGEFFIKSLFEKLSHGYSIKKSFEMATELTEVFTHRGGPFKKKQYLLDNALQHPLLDDNGDGIGSNVLTANGDGNKLASLMFGTGHDYLVNAPDNPAEILDVTLPQYLTEKKDDTSALLLLQANIPDKVDPATIEIRPPSKILNQVQDSTEQIAIELETHPLKYNEDSELFEFAYAGFTESGRYDIFYTVRDKNTKEKSPFYHSAVYKNRPGNLPPNSFKLISPSNKSFTQTVLIFDWESTDDPDDEPITYSLIIAEDQNFNNIVYQENELIHSMAFVDSGYLVINDDESHEDEEYNAHILEDLAEYFWKVEAVDMYGAVTSSNIHSFNTNNTNAPPGIVSVQVNNTLDGTPVENVEITLDQHNPEKIIADQGRYIFQLPPPFSELYSMWLNVPGYTLRRTRAKADFIPLEIVTGITTEINVSLEPCTGSSCKEMQPAQFSFATKLLTIPTVKVPNIGDFSVQLQGDDSFTFTVLTDKLSQLSEVADYVGNFSFETGQLFLPHVKVVMPSSEKKLYKVTMELVPNSEPLQFRLLDAVEIQ